MSPEDRIEEAQDQQVEETSSESQQQEAFDLEKLLEEERRKAAELIERARKQEREKALQEVETYKRRIQELEDQLAQVRAEINRNRADQSKAKTSEEAEALRTELQALREQWQQLQKQLEEERLARRKMEILSQEARDLPQELWSLVDGRSEDEVRDEIERLRQVYQTMRVRILEELKEKEPVVRVEAPQPAPAQTEQQTTAEGGAVNPPREEPSQPSREAATGALNELLEKMRSAQDRDERQRLERQLDHILAQVIAAAQSEGQ